MERCWDISGGGEVEEAAIGIGVNIEVVSRSGNRTAALGRRVDREGGL